MKTDELALTEEDVARFLSAWAEMAEAVEQGVYRWFGFDAELEVIVFETLYPTAVYDLDCVARKDVLESVAPTWLSAWKETPRLHLSVFNKGGDMTLIHTAVAEERPALVAVLKDRLDEGLRGTHIARTRQEVLGKPHGAEALATWESGDDSRLTDAGAAWARRIQPLIAENQAKLRWGMLPIGKD